MNLTPRQRIGFRRLLTVVAAFFPLFLAGGVWAPGASAGRINSSKSATNSLETAVARSDEMLHDVPRGGDAVLAEFSVSGHGPRVVRMLVTAYCPCAKCCGPGARGLTASGCSVTYNCGLFVAADTDRFPLGTRLTVPGYAHDQPVEVIDRGSAIKGNHIDIYFPTHQQAMAWGRKYVTVVVNE